MAETSTSGPITAEQSVPAIVEQYPETQSVFKAYGMNTTYKALYHENLSASAAVNQINVDSLLNDLNQVVQLSQSSAG